MTVPQGCFVLGTKLDAWLFTILRNLFYSQCRKQRCEVEDAKGAAAARLVALPDQEHTAMLGRALTQMRRLPASQREALMLVGRRA